MGRWRPLLDGSDAARAIEVAVDVAAALGRAGPRPEVAAYGPSSSGGTAGMALLLAELAVVTGDSSFEDAGMAFLDHALEGAPPVAACGLFTGFPGVAWALTRLEGRLVEPDPEEGDADEMVAAVLGRPAPWHGPYDLVAGLVGLGLFALARLPRPSARRSLLAVVEHLAAMAEHHPAGATWRTDARWVGPERAAQYPDGYYDLGVAHGAAGAVAFLSAAAMAGVPGAGDLLRDATRWLVAQELEGGPSRYPALFGDGERPGPSRTAWCYGDGGVAVALMAAEAAGAMDGGAGLRLARDTAGRPFERTGVRDAGLCHGAAGLAQVHNRLWQATGDARLADSARRWLDVALGMRRPGEGVAGFVAWVGAPGRAHEWEAKPGLLEGATGVALALLAAASPTEPTWDDLLLLRPPSVWQGAYQ